MPLDDVRDAPRRLPVPQGRHAVRPRGAAENPRRRRSGSAPDPSPTRTFVPISIVIGRSVFSRTVRHGMPSTVVSSWMPPESVMTSRACRIADEIEVAERLDEPQPGRDRERAAADPIIFRVRG